MIKSKELTRNFAVANLMNTVFSKDYFEARHRFRCAASELSFQLQAVPISAAGPGGEELTIDVASLKQEEPEALLVISSGLHGTEAIFGSAVQLAVMEKLGKTWPADKVGLLLLHSLNPYGFAWMRRANEANVDLNRNFLLPHEDYEGCPPKYRDLDLLLNPKRPPSGWEFFTLRAYWYVLRHGLPALMQAVAGGQYEFPQGLFYGGSGPSETMTILQQHLGGWLGKAQRILHLDMHTGLGKSATYKLLLDHPIGPAKSQFLRHHFGEDAVEECNTHQTAYETRGSLGRWCVPTFADRDCTYVCAEFGTYPPLKVLHALRAENQAHHWSTPDSPETKRAKERVREMLNPASNSWREEVLRKSLVVVDQAVTALMAGV